MRLLSCLFAAALSIGSASATVVQYDMEGHFQTSDFASIAVGDAFSAQFTIDYSAPWESDVPNAEYILSSYLNGMLQFTFAFSGFNLSMPSPNPLVIAWEADSGVRLPSHSLGFSSSLTLEGGIITPRVRISHPAGSMPSDHLQSTYGEIVGQLAPTAFEFYVSAYIPSEQQSRIATTTVTSSRMAVISTVPETGSTCLLLTGTFGIIALLRTRRACGRVSGT